MTRTTLLDILEQNRDVDRAVTYIEGENSERRCDSARCIRARSASCTTCRRMGAQRGDKMIIFLSNNEQFLDGFWAAMCGGIVPVPLAVGISDEHRHKLLRVARKLGNPLLYTDCEEPGAPGRRSPPQVGRDRAVRASSSRAASWSNRSPTSRGPASCSARTRRTWRSFNSPPARPASRRA